MQAAAAAGAATETASLGIDVGTSSLKATLIGRRGDVLADYRTPVPIDWSDRRADIGSAFVDALETAVIADLRSEGIRLEAVVVAAVAPAAASVDPETGRVRLAFSHLDDAGGFEDEPSEAFGSRLAVRAARTRHRLGQAERQPVEKGCALSTALAYRLTGVVAEDAVANYELGQVSEVNQASQLASRLQFGRATPELVLATTDSIASAYGAGARLASDVLVYFGTFFCALQLRRPIVELLRLRRLDSLIPYAWRASLPQYGDQIHNLLTMLLPDRSSAERFDYWDAVLGSGVESSVVVRVEPTGPRGSAATPSLSIRDLRPTTASDHLLAALGRPFGEALNQAFTEAEREHLRFFVEGGASRLTELRLLTAALAGCNLAPPETNPGGAIGAAQIAVNESATRRLSKERARQP